MRKSMPRQARIDAPGALHHIIVRGIDRTTVFVDDIDRKNFLGSSEFAERTLKGAGDERDRRARLRSAGIDLNSVVEAVCRHLGVDQGELAGPTKRAAIARARALIACMATVDLSISGSEVARRLNVDRSAVSPAVRRVRGDED